jgi:HK97 gp10 family phage protein
VARGKVKVVVTGVADLDRALRALPAKIGNKVVRQALRKGAKTFAAAARAKAPKETGKLESAIKVRAGRRSRTGIAVAVVVGAESFDGPGEYLYPVASEFGTSKMKAQPYLRPAFDALKSAVEAQVIADIRAGVEREAAKT